MSSDENVREEYKALISYHNTVVTYRFTLLGFFAAAIAFIAKQGLDLGQSILILVLTIALYIVERRNRFLYLQMGKRALEIEMNHWKMNRIADNDKTVSLFCRFYINEVIKLNYEVSDDLKKEAKQTSKYSSYRYFSSHTIGLDIFYFSVFLYSVWSIFCNLRYISWGIDMDTWMLYILNIIITLALLFVGSGLIKAALRNESKNSVGIIIIGLFIILVSLAFLFFFAFWQQFPRNE
jgi:hypothetical protein